jgi:hypothetical protein
MLEVSSQARSARLEKHAIAGKMGEFGVVKFC